MMMKCIAAALVCQPCWIYSLTDVGLSQIPGFKRDCKIRRMRQICCFRRAFQKLKVFQLQGASPPDPLTMGQRRSPCVSIPHDPPGCEHWAVQWPRNIAKVIDGHITWKLSVDFLLAISISVDVSYIISGVMSWYPSDQRSRWHDVEVM